MINLEIEADRLAHIIDKPFNFALKRRLIYTIIQGRAILLRQSIMRNRKIPNECIQSFGIPIEKVQSLSNYHVDNYKISVVTKYTIQQPIRYDFDTPFVSVTSLDGSINFTHSDLNSIKFNSHAGQFVSGTGRYIYHGEKIAAYHNEPALLTATMLLVRGVFENPLDVRDYSGLYTYNEEHFPMPADMIMTIGDMIKKGDLTIAPETQQITINDK